MDISYDEANGIWSTVTRWGRVTFSSRESVERWAREQDKRFTLLQRAPAASRETPPDLPRIPRLIDNAL